MIYDLVDCKDKVLKESAIDFDFKNPPEDSVDFACNLAETMLEHHGIGLAANQCGFPYRVFVLQGDGDILPFFNPRIVDVSEETILLEEGCLSFPGLFVKVKRPRKIKIRFTEPDGQTQTRTYDGMTARAIQHEMDHLNGINYQQRSSRIHLEQARNAFKKRLRKQSRK